MPGNIGFKQVIPSCLHHSSSDSIVRKSRFKFFIPICNLLTYFRNVPFLYLLKMSEKQRFAEFFRGHRNRTFCFNGLKTEIKVLTLYVPVISFISVRYQCIFPAGIYLLKVNNRNTRTRCEICSKLNIGVFLLSLLLTLYMFHTLF